MRYTAQKTWKQRDYKTTTEEIVEVIKMLKSGKAAGNYWIATYMVKMRQTF